MWRNLTHALGAGVVATVAAAPQVSSAETAASILEAQPPKVVERLFERGVVLVDSPDDFVRALVVFKQPLPEVWALITQTGRQGEYRPELKDNDEVEAYSDGNLVQQRMKVMFVNIRYRLRYRHDEVAGRQAWELDPEFDNSLKRVEGFLELFELDETQTLGRFGTAVNVGAALPGFLQDWTTRKNVPETVERLRKWVDSGGAWRH